MIEELEYEYEVFLNDMERGESFCRYFDENDYEDEYSHNEINEYQLKFIDKIKKYLHDNKPCQYVVIDGWCVFVMTIEEAEKRKMRHLDDCLVK